MARPDIPELSAQIVLALNGLELEDALVTLGVALTALFEICEMSDGQVNSAMDFLYEGSLSVWNAKKTGAPANEH